MKKYNCNKCKDKKHIFNVKTGIWEDCGCLKQNKIEEKYLTSHLPKLYWNYGWKDCLKDFESLSKEIYFLKKVVELQLKSKGFKKFLYIYSENQEVGKCLVSVMFREFIKKGLACNIISLEQLVDAEFDKELRKEIVYDNYNIDCLCVLLGEEKQNKWNSVCFVKIHNHRKDLDKFTIFLSTKDIIKKIGMYGISATSLFSKMRKLRLNIE